MAALPETKAPTVAAIEAAYAARRTARDGYRLPASQLGEACERRLWYGFRWVSPPARFEGPMLRLFETGNREEARLIEDLRAIGASVIDRDEAGRQIGVSFADGHGFGFLDGEVTGVPEAPVVVHVLELKTHNDKSFRKLLELRVREAQPKHWAQCMIYMHARNRERAFYLAVNKNTDELYVERIRYDLADAVALNLKAERIAYADRPPARLSDDSEHWACRYCDHRGVCHEGAFARRNCRTCLHATPERGGAWTCRRFASELTREAQEAGCAHHLFIPDLVPGQQIDADVGEGWIAYHLADGSLWRDVGGGFRP
jgi:hypothetical protein